MARRFRGVRGLRGALGDVKELRHERDRLHVRLEDPSPLDRGELDALMADKLSFTGAAGDQVASLVSSIEQIAKQHPQAAAYAPGSIL